MWIVTLPAEEALSVSPEVYLGGVLPVGRLPVALRAEFPCLRFRRDDGPRAYLVLHRGGMARRTADERMGRKALDPCDLAMTGGALAGDLRRDGVVRVVTRGTGLERIVENRIDLRKSCGPRRIVVVTAQAGLPFLRREGLV